jgi:ABC-type transporter Mla maintaining outer membrane lipid asymmetry ATPase subunit MlaF
MLNDPINTAHIEKFIKTVKSADFTNQKQVTFDINTAKNISYSLGLVLSRLNNKLEQNLNKKPSNEEVVQINVDGGKGW